MKIFKIVILLLLTIFLFQACFVVHRQTVVDFDYCYNNTKTGIENLIDINGYYEINRYSENGKEKIWTKIIVFSEDGIFIQTSSLDLLRYAYNHEKWNSKGFDIGVYSIHNDTIRVQYIFIGSTTSGCETVVYKIIDSTTLSQFFYGNCDTPSKAFLGNHSVSAAKFIPYDTLPIIDRIWIKNKDWFWCDKEKYKKWKKQNK